MDQSLNPRRRWNAFTAAALLAVFALAAAASTGPRLFAQTTSATDPGGAAGTPGPAADAIEQVEGNWEGLVKVAIVIAIFVVPMIVGSWLAKRLRMPDHGWKFAIGIGAIAAAAVTVATGEVKYGPDLSGGITLIYELADQSTNAVATPQDGAEQDSDQAEDADDEEAADDESGAQFENESGYASNDTIASLISVLTERIDPAGTKEISIRKYGEGQIEIIIPRADEQELEYIERRISTAGQLVFRITASRRFEKHRQFIELAERLPSGQDIVRLGDNEAARWVELDKTEFPTLEEANARGLVTRVARDMDQALVLTNDGLDVTGERLKSVAPDVGETGEPQVAFSFDAQGAFAFGRLTGDHLPTASGEQYNLGILLDNRLLSAPTIESRITDRGVIRGRMSEEEVNFLVGILKAGALPAALNKEPISRAQISPTLGAETVRNGKLALSISLALVAVFMLLYYRKAGIIAVLGLATNMLLIVGCMVLIKAAFTLPGLAGLVLTVGMSVDANVLIYERIREELKRGAALRMAIRNGFSRATTAIIDSNVTNLITGIVIYKIAPDNVKGFGVTLVLGILMSVFVAVFLTRIVFDVAERRGWIKTLGMAEIPSPKNFDFLKWRHAAIGASLVVIAVGLIAAGARRNDLLDIDFTGGSSVQFVLREDQKMPFDEVMDVLQETNLADANLSLVEVGNTQTHYTVTTVDDNVREVEQILTDAFAGKLETYEISVSDPVAIPAESATGSIGPRRRALDAMLTLSAPIGLTSMLQAQEDAAAIEETDTTAEPAADSAAPEEDDSQDSADAETESAEATPPADAPAADEPAAGEAAAETDGDGTSSEAADAEASADSADESSSPFASGGSSATIKFASADDAEGGLAGGVSYPAIEQLLLDALKGTGHDGVAYDISNPNYAVGTARNFDEWTIKLALPVAEAQQVLDHIEGGLTGKPVFPLSNKIGGRVASRMAADAIAAIVLCLAGIIGYVWFRFHGVVYGFAAVVALIHDVLVALGFVALSAYLVTSVPPLANLLMVDKFQISLTLVAAFLTIIGYSLNDTIVIFDRIREVKGKSPRLTAEIINAAVNQTFSRTLLTSFTSLMSVIVLYIVGGAGIHAFAFALLIGFIAGVYSTIFIANPVLLWLAQRADAAATNTGGSKAA
jgi:SecD/SecF fusion protein